MGDGADDVSAARQKPRAHNGQAFRALLAQGVGVIAFWIIAGLKNGSFEYGIASLWTFSFLVGAGRFWARSTGAPEWSADEAYVTRWRRWRRSQRAGP